MRQATYNWLNQASLKQRKHYGQYMTPNHIRAALLNQLDIKSDSKVLEPSVGTGEFLADINGENMYGWDIDKEVLKVAAINAPKANLFNKSALDDHDAKFDFVIGNPPYFQIYDKELKQKFAEVISGRPNIFSFFFKAGLEALNPGGYLAYVVPPSMNCGAYFQALREYIVSKGVITHLQLFAGASDFDNATTSIQIIVIKKKLGTNNKHVLKVGNRLIFSEDALNLAELRAKGKTLSELGWKATTGTVDWSKNKDRLYYQPGKDRKRLVWAKTINDQVNFSLTTKPTYITSSVASQLPSIAVNRIIGSVGAGRIRAAHMPSDSLAENHVNLLTPVSKGAISPEKLLKALRKPETTSLARKLTGNTQISAGELNHLLVLEV